MLDPYRAVSAIPKAATMVLTLTIAPLPRSAIAGARSATRRNGAFTFTAWTASISFSVVLSVGPSG
ncbi:hypothetical protein GCM10009564_09000 [Streptomyces thermogriseus]|uniref:Uncharacterized protein n=1 Tax=Streptomyces thermogriseus TaxID=75292 RepID=A0ABN1SUS9_9ACTN